MYQSLLKVRKQQKEAAERSNNATALETFKHSSVRPPEFLSNDGDGVIKNYDDASSEESIPFLDHSQNSNFSKCDNKDGERNTITLGSSEEEKFLEESPTCHKSTEDIIGSHCEVRPLEFSSNNVAIDNDDNSTEDSIPFPDHSHHSRRNTTILTSTEFSNCDLKDGDGNSITLGSSEDEKFLEESPTSHRSKENIIGSNCEVYEEPREDCFEREKHNQVFADRKMPLISYLNYYEGFDFEYDQSFLQDDPPSSGASSTLEELDSPLGEGYVGSDILLHCSKTPQQGLGTEHNPDIVVDTVETLKLGIKSSPSESTPVIISDLDAVVVQSEEIKSTDVYLDLVINFKTEDKYSEKPTETDCPKTDTEVILDVASPTNDLEAEKEESLSLGTESNPVSAPGIEEPDVIYVTLEDSAEDKEKASMNSRNAIKDVTEDVQDSSEELLNINFVRSEQATFLNVSKLKEYDVEEGCDYGEQILEVPDLKDKNLIEVENAASPQKTEVAREEVDPVEDEIRQEMQIYSGIKEILESSHGNQVLEIIDSLNRDESYEQVKEPHNEILKPLLYSPNLSGEITARKRKIGEGSLLEDEGEEECLLLSVPEVENVEFIKEICEAEKSECDIQSSDCLASTSTRGKSHPKRRVPKIPANPIEGKINDMMKELRKEVRDKWKIDDTDYSSLEITLPAPVPSHPHSSKSLKSSEDGTEEYTIKRCLNKKDIRRCPKKNRIKLFRLIEKGIELEEQKKRISKRLQKLEEEEHRVRSLLHTSKNKRNLY